MLKPGLGKGLGDLMRGDEAARKNGASEEGLPRATPTFGRGLQTLVGVAARTPEPIDTPVKPPPILPTWFYFAGDVLLLAFTIAITLDAQRPFDAGTVIFCAASISIGAMLGILGVLQGSNDASPAGSNGHHRGKT